MSASPQHALDHVQHVRIAEIKVASQGLLKATLGSCVAIALIDHRTGLCGLAHCLLPHGASTADHQSARFVDTVVPNLLKAVGIDVPPRRGLEVFIAGGARMIPEKDLARIAVGEMNVAAARAALEKHHIRFKVLDVGGTQACSVLVDCDSLTVTSSRIHQMAADKVEDFHGIESRN